MIKKINSAFTPDIRLECRNGQYRGVDKYSKQLLKSATGWSCIGENTISRIDYDTAASMLFDFGVFCVECIDI